MQTKPDSNTESKLVDERIVSFLKGNTNLTLATCSANIPYCADCFYVYEEKRNLLIFKSKPETYHIKQAKENRSVAGSITPDRLNAARIQGIQFCGSFLEPGKELEDPLKKAYYKKYPFALSFPGNIWAIELDYIKMTDNTLGFGNKIEWSAGTPLEKN